MFTQLVTPTPDIPCQPGWCLQYVRQTFGAPAVEPTATAGWYNAEHRHKDMDFPEGCAVPVWFALEYEPAGHVALLMPDWSVYSTSDDATVPHHHPSLDDLIAYYWRNPLTYLGWSEDISGVRVVEPVTINVESTMEDTLSASEVQEIKEFIAGPVVDEIAARGNAQLDELRKRLDDSRGAIIGAVGGNPEKIARELVEQLGEGLAADVVSEVGKQLAQVGAKLSS